MIDLTFELQLDAFAKEDVPKAMFDLMRAIGLSALQSLVFMTPVDTGRARGNWIVSVGGSDHGSSESVDRSGGATIADGSIKMATLEGDPFNVVRLQNNLPYIEELEGGSSLQAPSGMLTVTIANLESQFG